MMGNVTTFFCKIGDYLIESYCLSYGASQVAQRVKNLPAMWETWIQSLGWEDSLEEGMTTHFSIPARRIPWTEKPGGAIVQGSQRVGHNRATNTFTFVL